MKDPEIKDMLSRKPEELLEDELCNCGTINELIEEALAEAYKNMDKEGCIIWRNARQIMVVQIMANILAFMEMDGPDDENGRKEAKDIIDDCQAMTSNIMKVCSRHIAKRIFEEVEIRKARDEARGRSLN